MSIRSLPKGLGRGLGVALALLPLGCFDTRTDGRPQDVQDGETVTSPVVTVDLTTELATVPALAYGMHSSVYDNAIHAEEMSGLLEEAGIALLRWPGGGYSDNYHWSNHTMTPFADGEVGYLAERTDFGNYAQLVAELGKQMMITVNYGSNLAGDGPGEPKEAAAWVAYANGEPDDTREIGVDGSGEDWQTVGYWASLRAASPLASEDGKNFLRIARAEPFGIEYWEIGNEVFGNGYHGDGLGFELDLHVPYDGVTEREGNEALSGTTYGAGVVAYIEEMKAVDPGIKVGAVLNTPPDDYNWGPVWNQQVLTECGPLIDFGVVHWYPGRDAASLLRAPRSTVPRMVEELRASFEALAGDNASRIELTMTELGPGVGINLPRSQSQVRGLFAIDSILSLLAQGFVNIDWLELHNGSFLSEQSQAKGPAFHGISLAHRLAAPGDTLVAAGSNTPGIVAHAARHADGAVALILLNTLPPGDAALPASITVNVTGEDLPPTAERYDYAPATGAVSGEVTGPTPVDDLGSSFTTEIAPYSAALFVFEAP